MSDGSRGRVLGAAVMSVLALLAVAAPAFAADIQRKLQVGGRERTYTVHVPPGATDSRAMPLVLVLHGGGGSGAGAAMQTGFNAEADRKTRRNAATASRDARRGLNME